MMTEWWKYTRLAAKNIADTTENQEDGFISVFPTFHDLFSSTLPEDLLKMLLWLISFLYFVNIIAIF